MTKSRFTAFLGAMGLRPAHASRVCSGLAYVVGACLACVLTVAAAPAGDLNRGKQPLLSGNYEQAAELCPDDADVYFCLEDAYRGAKQDDDAVKASRASLKLSPGQVPTAVKPTPTPGAIPGGKAPEDVLRRVLMAQVRGDVEAMLAEAALDMFDEKATGIARTTLQSISGKLVFDDYRFEPVITGYSSDGTMALVRFRYSVTVKANGESFPQAGGNMALLVKRGDAWKVHSIVADELLTLQVLDEKREPGAAAPAAQALLPRMNRLELAEHAVMVPGAVQMRPAARVVSAVYTGPQPPVAFAQLIPRPPVRDRFVDVQKVNDAISKTIFQWRVDEGKVFRDEFYSAWGHVPIVGDVISSGYTIFERINTVTNELPQDIREGNVTAALTDIGITAWGTVQIIAEPIPGVDAAADQVELVIDQYRYHHIQRQNYYIVYRKVLNSNFKGDPRYLFLRYTSKNMPKEGESAAIKTERYTEWKGRWPALKRLTILTDGWMRANSPIVFDVGLQMTMKRTESEDIFEAMKALGAMTKRVGSFDDQEARLEVRLTGQAVRDASSGAPIFTNFRVMGRPYVAYDLACSRGVQKLVVELRDGSRTQPAEVDNLVLNAITGFQLQLPDGRRLDSHKMNQGDSVSKARLVPVMAKQDKFKVEPPELTGLKCLKTQVMGTDLLSVTTHGRWPDAALDLEAKQGGMAVYEAGFPDAEGVPPLKGGITIEIAGEAKKPAYEYVLTQIQRRGLGGEAGQSTQGDFVPLPGSDTQYSRTWTVKSTRSDGSGKVVDYSYQVSVSASVGVPSVMRPGQTITIPITVSVSTGGPTPLSAVLGVTAPNWKPEQAKPATQSPSPFGFDLLAAVPIHIVKIADSGVGPAQDAIELSVPEITGEGGAVTIGFELHVRGKRDSTMTDAANLELGRAFTYTSRKTR